MAEDATVEEKIAWLESLGMNKAYARNIFNYFPEYGEILFGKREFLAKTARQVREEDRKDFFNRLFSPDIQKLITSGQYLTIACHYLIRIYQAAGISKMGELLNKGVSSIRHLEKITEEAEETGGKESMGLGKSGKILSRDDALWLNSELGYPLHDAETQVLAQLLVKHKKDLFPEIKKAVGKDYRKFFETLRTFFYEVITTTPDLTAVRNIAQVSEDLSTDLFMGLEPALPAFRRDKTALQYLGELAQKRRILFFYAFRSVRNKVTSANFRAVCSSFIAIMGLIAQTKTPNFFLDPFIMDAMGKSLRYQNDIIPAGYALVSAYKDGAWTWPKGKRFCKFNESTLLTYISKFIQTYGREPERIRAAVLKKAA